MPQESTIKKINSILKELDKDSQAVLLQQLQRLQGYALAESIDKGGKPVKRISMKEIVEEVRKVRRKRNAGRRHAA